MPAAAAIVLLAAADAAVRRAGTLLAAAALGIACGAGSLYRIEAALEGGSLAVEATDVAEFTGVLRADSLLSREGDTLLRLRVRGAATAGGIDAAARADALVIVRGDWRFAAGERLSVSSGLRTFDSTGRERYVAGVNRDDIRRSGFSSPVWLLRARIREWLHRAIAGIGYPASALLEALLIGAREDVPADLSEGFRSTGSLHVLALSGLHAGIVFAFVSAMLRPVRSRLAVYLAGSALLAGYLFVAGLMPSLVRAVVMLTVGGAARLADRDDEPLNLLAISGIVIVAADPFAAATLSFQLSFLALAGILSLGPVLGRPLEGRVPPLLAVPLAASAGAAGRDAARRAAFVRCLVPLGHRGGPPARAPGDGVPLAGPRVAGGVPAGRTVGRCVGSRALRRGLPGDRGRHRHSRPPSRCHRDPGSRARVGGSGRGGSPGARPARASRGAFGNGMGALNHDSPAEIRAVLERRSIGLKKRWGQNFLVNRGRASASCRCSTRRPGAWRGRSARASGR